MMRSMEDKPMAIVKSDPSLTQFVRAGIKTCKPLILFLLVLWVPALLILAARVVEWFRL